MPHVSKKLLAVVLLALLVISVLLVVVFAQPVLPKKLITDQDYTEEIYDDVLDMSLGLSKTPTKVVVTMSLIRPTRNAGFQACVSGNVGFFNGAFPIKRTYCSSADVLTVSFNYGSDITVQAKSPTGYSFKQWKIYKNGQTNTPSILAYTNPYTLVNLKANVFIWATWNSVQYDRVTIAVAQGVGQICAQAFSSTTSGSVSQTVIYDCVSNTAKSGGRAVSKTLLIPHGLKVTISAQSLDLSQGPPYLYRFQTFKSNVAFTTPKLVKATGYDIASTTITASDNSYIHVYFKHV